MPSLSDLPRCELEIITESPGIPPSVTRRLLDFVSRDTRHSLRLTCKSWAQAIDIVIPHSRPAANRVPPEILIQILYMLSPRDFDNARRSCSRWMRASLNERLLERMLKRAGWWDSWRRDFQSQPSDSGNCSEQSLAWRMSRRFATECVLSGRKINVERAKFLTTSVIDFSELSQGKPGPDYQRSAYSISAYAKEYQSNTPATSRFHVSNCGSYLLVVSGCMIYVYQLLARRPGSFVPGSVDDLKGMDIAAVASITCPVEVLSATIDASTSKFVVAALLHNRLGMICDLVPARRHSKADSAYSNVNHHARFDMKSMKMASRHFYYDVCSAQDPPRSVTICPGRRCVAFGSGSGIELRWVDEQTNKDCRKHFPMTQPSEILHFLPNRPGIPEYRLISSLAGPGMSGCECQNLPSAGGHEPCPFHMSDAQSFGQMPHEQTDRTSLVRATQIHHYRAIPINDGLHVLFIEPRTGSLCIGSDAPLDGPTNLTKALVCVPPFGNDSSEFSQEGLVPTVFAAGSDLNWGLRVVAAYRDRIVLYSVPLDVFNVIKRERERQGGGFMGDSDLARDFFLRSQRAHQRRGSLAQNQNGDWEFLLSVKYRPTAMMWPFKIYGKEIGLVDNVVELALQSSHGGARIWAFGASGETSIIDVDTFTSCYQQESDVPCRSLSIGPDGRVASAQLVDRSEHFQFSPGLPRKRKHCEPRLDFVGQHMLHRLGKNELVGVTDSHGVLSNTIKRRTSIAACIVDFQIPEHEGRWLETEPVY